MQMNDFIRISYTGKIKEGGQEFDKGEKIPVVVGAGYVVKGLDEALQGMEIGDKKTVEISPDKAFGERKPELIKLVPESEFKKHDTKPYPGMFIKAENMQGRVLSVSSGRVKVDFNHPLAGKVLVYDVEINSKIEDAEEKIRAVFEFYTRTPSEKLKLEMKEGEVEIYVAPIIHAVIKKRIAEDIIKFIGLEKVKFAEVFEKGKTESKQF
ncbi:MAG: peptidylprolyl isomerase [Candidatus Aenigmatarchaeota archaeon]